MLLLLCFTVSPNKLPYFGNIGENGRFIRAISGRWCTPALSTHGGNACAISGRWCTAVSPGINSRAFETRRECMCYFGHMLHSRAFETRWKCMCYFGQMVHCCLAWNKLPRFRNKARMHVLFRADGALLSRLE